AIFDAKRVAKVLAEFIALDLRLPAVEVLAVEQADPTLGRLRLLSHRRGCEENHRRQTDRYPPKRFHRCRLLEEREFQAALYVAHSHANRSPTMRPGWPSSSEPVPLGRWNVSRSGVRP